MRQSVAAVSSALALLAILLFINFPFGRQVIPDIAHFFSEREGIWQSVRQSEYPDRRILHNGSLKDTVTVVRDERGVPHIFARNNHDALTTLGFVTAEDRFHQLFMNPRIVAGQLSAWMGESYESVDKAFLNLGLEEAAWRYHNSMSSEEYAMVDAYKSGINSYVNQFGSSHKPFENKILPVSYRYWRPVDCARVWKYWDFLQSYSYDDPLNHYLVNSLSKKEIEVLFPQTDSRQSAVTEVGGSRAFYRMLSEEQADREKLLKGANFDVRGTIISGDSEATQTGDPIMAADLHLPFTLPSQLYEVHIVTPNANVHGVTFPGIPVVLSGFNNNVSWSATPYKKDVVDYKPVLKSKDGKKYRYTGDEPWRNITTQSYSIEKRNGTTSKHQVQFTNRGVLRNTSERSYELRWSALASGEGAMLNYWKVGQSKTNEEAIQYAKAVESPPTKMVFASREGVRSLYPAKHPYEDETSGISNALKKDADKAKTLEWQVAKHDGVSAFSELDILDNKQEFSGRLAYPLHPWKNKRLNRVERSIDELTLDRTHRLLQDVKLAQEELLPYIRESISGTNQQELKDLVSALEEWDFRATINSRLTVYVEKFMRLLRQNIWDELPESASPSDHLWLRLAEKNPDHPIFDIENTKRKENFRDLIKKTVQEAYEMAVIENGNFNSWSWTTATTIEPIHITGSSHYDEFVNYKFSRGGFQGTIQEIKNRNVPYGPVWRMVVDFSQQSVQARVMMRGGASGNPFSAYYRNGMNEWNTNRYYTVINVDSPDLIPDKTGRLDIFPVN